MVDIVTRAAKGSALTYNEMDTNFANLKAAIEALQPVANPWTPANLASTVAWWDASETSSLTIASGTASAWTDKKNGIVASNSTAAQQPAYSATALNSKPGLTFDGVNDRLAFPTNSFLPVGTAPLTVLIVARAGATAGDMAIVTWGTAANGQWIKIGEDGTSPNPAIGDLYTAGAALGTAAFPSTTQILAYTASTTATRMYNDGLTGGSGPNPGSKNTNGSAGFIGMDLRTVGFWNSVIQEIVVCTGVLSTADRQKYEGYAALKWGLRANLASDHPYKTTGPSV